MKRLAGKNALITGSARGIGLAFAETYVREGARVVIADIDIVRAKASAEAINQDNPDAAIAVQMDVTDQASIDAALEEAVAALGQIDILINNAAIFTAAPLVEITRADYDRTFNINVAGSLGAGRSIAIDPEGRILHQAGECQETIALEIDPALPRRTRERGVLSLGQTLKSFRDSRMPFPAYEGENRSAGELSRLGVLEMPAIDDDELA